MKNQERTEVIDCSMFHLAEESEVVYKRFENLGGEFSKERKKKCIQDSVLSNSYVLSPLRLDPSFCSLLSPIHILDSLKHLIKIQSSCMLI